MTTSLKSLPAEYILHLMRKELCDVLYCMNVCSGHACSPFSLRIAQHWICWVPMTTAADLRKRHLDMAKFSCPEERPILIQDTVRHSATKESKWGCAK